MRYENIPTMLYEKRSLNTRKKEKNYRGINVEKKKKSSLKCTKVESGVIQWDFGSSFS